MTRRAAVLWMACLLLGLTLPLAAMAIDTDGDGVEDSLDNCLTLPNAPPLDCDTDHDGYGNACDGSFNNDPYVNAGDAVDCISTYDPPVSYPWCFGGDLMRGVDSGTGTDMDCNGVVNSNDLERFIPSYQRGAPGPSGLACAGTIPCP